MKSKKVLLHLASITACVLGFALSATATPRQTGQNWGGVNLPYSIYFKLVRNNIPAAHFHVVMGGECTAEDGSTYSNTFDFGQRDFPDLLVNARGRVHSTANDVTSGTGQVGDLSIDCRFTKSGGAYSKASCLFSFDAPARGSEQLDSCIGGVNFSHIVPARR